MPSFSFGAPSLIETTRRCRVDGGTHRSGPRDRRHALRAIPPLVVVGGSAALDGAVVSALVLLAQGGEAGGAALALAALGAGAFLVTGIARGDYRPATLLQPRGHAGRAVRGWLALVCLALAVAFFAPAASTLSRAPAAALLIAGLVALPLTRHAVARIMQGWAASGRLVLKRIMVVGDAAEIEGFLSRYAPPAHGLRLVNAIVLRTGSDTLDDDLALAVATGRLTGPDDVYLLLSWSESGRITRSIDALQRLPAAIHLGPTTLLERYSHLAVDRVGPIASVRMVRQPLTPGELRCKRAFDVAVALAALVALAPVFGMVALAIKLDSPGPVFFRQRRTGFNMRPFRILKFRSMRTMEDGSGLRQVTDRDPRVTRVGRVLRRSSLDELPQLLNVLKGDMSLIGPRPHAIAHDIAFGRTHGLYPRRHVMRPGITGWAQVSGFRGETDTPDKIAGRVRHDLAYVDNWSLGLDLRILLKTVFSPQTFHGAK